MTWRRWVDSPWVLALNALVFVLIAVGFGREYIRTSAIRHEIRDLQEREASLTDSLASLRAYQDYLSTEAFVEQEAREKFGLQKPGEVQVVVAPSAAQATPVASVTSVSNATWWLWYFFDPDRYETMEKEVR